MARLKIGDRIDCRIRSHYIVSPYDDFDSVKTFEIIGLETRGYYLYIPANDYIKDSIRIDEYNYEDFGIDKKFVGDEIAYITEKMIYKVNSKLDGCFCYKCKEFYAFAEPNQSDGTLLCFSCRVYPFYKSTPDDD